MSWTTPTKKINVPGDVARFKQSEACRKLQSGISEIVQLVQGLQVPAGVMDPVIVTRGDHPTQPMIESSGNCGKLVEMFDQLSRAIDETPPVHESSRFGNRAYRDWSEKSNGIIETGLSQLEYPGDDGLVKEVGYYIFNSMGNSTRLDFGSGHELSFTAAVIAFLEYGVVPRDGSQLLVLFGKYYDVCRKLILTYNLEPAGSHGVWGLDDHFHFSYIIGASEFVGDSSAPAIRNSLTPPVLSSYKLSNMFINSLAFILKLKSGPFNEHSPVLYDVISRVRTWEKVRQGLLKMYMVEVLGKFPVVQHFYFGRLYRFD